MAKWLMKYYQHIYMPLTYNIQIFKHSVLVVKDYPARFYTIMHMTGALTTTCNLHFSYSIKSINMFSEVARYYDCQFQAQELKLTLFKVL